jgi:hypothetical protein
MNSFKDKQKLIIAGKKVGSNYAYKKPAQYVVELHQSKFTEYSIGDKLILFKEGQISAISP